MLAIHAGGSNLPTLTELNLDLYISSLRVNQRHAEARLALLWWSRQQDGESYDDCSLGIRGRAQQLALALVEEAVRAAIKADKGQIYFAELLPMARAISDLDLQEARRSSPLMPWMRPLAVLAVIITEAARRQEASLQQAALERYQERMGPIA